MGKYCLDTNVFIQAKNGPYAFDIVPAYWNFLDNKFSTGEIFSSWMVYEELFAGEDELADWVHERREKGYFVKPGKDVQNEFQTIANYVSNKYPSHNIRYFLIGADPWVIAHAKAEDATVVTHEIKVSDDSNKIKIPNICAYFKVKCIDPYKMLRELKARFS
jgi:predicted nucleic acid-binding protein